MPASTSKTPNVTTLGVRIIRIEEAAAAAQAKPAVVNGCAFVLFCFAPVCIVADPFLYFYEIVVNLAPLSGLVKQKIYFGEILFFDERPVTIEYVGILGGFMRFFLKKGQT